jgi:hypothetical protein
MCTVGALPLAFCVRPRASIPEASSSRVAAAVSYIAHQVRDAQLAAAMVGDAKVILPGADKKKNWSVKVRSWSPPRR